MLHYLRLYFFFLIQDGNNPKAGINSGGICLTFFQNIKKYLNSFKGIFLRFKTKNEFSFKIIYDIPCSDWLFHSSRLKSHLNCTQAFVIKKLFVRKTVFVFGMISFKCFLASKLCFSCFNYCLSLLLRTFLGKLENHLL